MVKREDKAMKLLKQNEEIQVSEAVCYLKQHGSFAGMPTVQSRPELSITPPAITRANGTRR